jgi:hypothetical protein
MTLLCEYCVVSPRPSALTSQPSLAFAVSLVGGGAAAGALENDALGMLRRALVHHSKLLCCLLACQHQAWVVWSLPPVAVPVRCSALDAIAPGMTHIANRALVHARPPVLLCLGGEVQALPVQFCAGGLLAILGVSGGGCGHMLSEISGVGGHCSTDGIHGSGSRATRESRCGGSTGACERQL